MTSIRLEGRQLRLRDWIADDLPGLRDVLRPGQRWQELDGPYYPRPSQEATEQLIERVGERIASGDWPDPRKTIAVADAATDALIGRVSWYWQSEETEWLSAGVVIFAEENWGRGLGFEALGLWSQYLLDTMSQLPRLDLRTWSGNPGMMRVAEKLGYRLEARFRDARQVDGKRYDGIGYGILRSEWESLYPRGFANREPR